MANIERNPQKEELGKGRALDLSSLYSLMMQTHWHRHSACSYIDQHSSSSPRHSAYFKLNAT